MEQTKKRIRQDWKTVIFSDETKINRFGSDGRVCIKGGFGQVIILMRILSSHHESQQQQQQQQDTKCYENTIKCRSRSYDKN
jgi:hypothetical protein